MKKHSDRKPDWKSQRDKIIGLGESSIRKSYYPELQQRHAELLERNKELQVAYEELTAANKELRRQYEKISKKELELRESEEKYLRVAETALEGIWVVDSGYRIILVNPHLAEMLGYSAEELVGRPALECMAEEEHALRAQRMQNRKMGIRERFESSLVRKDGSVITVIVSASPIIGDDGSFQGSFAMFTDITERKKAEEALKENEKFLTNVIENMPDMIFVKDARDLRFVRLNKAGEDLLGYRRDDLIGKNDYDFFPKEEADFFTGKDLAVLAGNAPIDIPEERIQTRLLGERILRTKKIPIPDESGIPRYLLGISEDITDYKQAEREKNRFGRILDSSVNEIFIFDAETLLFLDANRGARENLGYEIGELRRLTPLTIIPEFNRVSFEKILAPLRNGEVSERVFTTVHKRKDKSLYPVEVHLHVSTTESPPVFVAITLDISERRKAEEALDLARHKLSLLNTVTFQDIQTAAFSLSAYLELVKTVVTDDKARLYLEKQAAANQKILDALNFAKNYQDMGMENPRWQNVKQIFLLAISHLDFLSIRHDCRVDGLEVYADPLFENALFHMMQNVLRHGVQASLINLHYEEKPEGLILYIEDNGVGIPPGEKHMIFDRGHGKHTGLGLFLVREVLSITGIRIRETGDYGKGARFEMTIPRGIFRFLPVPEP